MFDAAPSPANIFAALAERAAKRPAQSAIVFEEEKVSYGELVEAVERAARHLVAVGIGRGDRVSAIAQNRPELLLLYYAVARIGAVYVPLNLDLTAAELSYAFAHSGSKLLFHDAASGEGVAGTLPEHRRLPIERLREPIDSLSLPAADAVGPHDDFLVIYTSGTTGKPKAILLDHGAQMGAAWALAEMWALTPDDVTLVALPLGFLYGLSTASAVGLQSGGTVVLMRRFRPREVLEALVAHRASIYHGVPTMFSMMLEYCEQQCCSFDLSGTRELISAGAPLLVEIRRRFADRFGKGLQNYYAMTECTPVFGRYSRAIVPVPDGSVGMAAPGLKYRIVRPDGSTCEVGEEGEILVRAAATLKAYLGAPEQTAAAFLDGYFRSGDLGYRDQDGFFFISGRIKDIIIRGGANISPSEVEEVLVRHEAVQDVAVVGAPDRIFGEVPVAFVIRRHGAGVTPEALIAHAERDLADFKVPRTYYFLESFPMGKTGKVDKAALRTGLAED